MDQSAILEKGGSGANPSVANAPSVPSTPAPQAAAVAPKIDKNDHIRGNKNARIALVEYSDLECPFCKTFHPTAQKVVDEYNGKVMWVYRHYPLSFHANAQKESEASECVYDQGGDDAFWKFIDAIYARTTSNGTGFALDKLGPLAAEEGVSEAKFTECLDSGKFAQKVKDQMTQGSKEGVSVLREIFCLTQKPVKLRLSPELFPLSR